MKRSLFAVVCVAGVAAALPAAEKDARTFELRVYTPNKGKQGEVNTLIASSGLKYMTKHGMTLLGAWTPTDPKDERVITLIAHKDRVAATRNQEAFAADEGWKSELAAASKNGRAVAGITRFFLTATDYSPAVKPAAVGDRLFELRTYVCTPNNLWNLNARFRDHTLKLFEKHGMSNVAYFNFPADEATTVGDLLKGCAAPGKDTSDVKADAPAAPLSLVYFITHKSEEAMKKSFADFGKDPAWTKALTESHKNGSLTARNGVKSLLLKATDYSPMK